MLQLKVPARRVNSISPATRPCVHTKCMNSPTAGHTSGLPTALSNGTSTVTSTVPTVTTNSAPAEVDNALCKHQVLEDACCQETQTLRSIRDIPTTRASMYLLRTDGNSCSRELVTESGNLHFAYPSTHQHMLVWRQKPQSVMVLKKLGDVLCEQMEALVEYLAAEEQMTVVVEPSVWQQMYQGQEGWRSRVVTYTQEDEGRLSDFVDFVVCLGGDGVLLHASYLFRRSIPPVLSFNLGSLGFLTNHGYSEYRKALREVIYGSQKLETCSMDGLGTKGEEKLGFHVTLRMRLECEIRRKDVGVTEVHEVLNEVVVDRGSSSFLTNLECYEKGRFITRVQADGVIVATPTGSTAYSVSAGGSMVHPNVPCILVTPICPHSLNFRPIIMPDYAEIELRVQDNARAAAWVCFDGKLRQELQRGDSVVVRMSSHPMPTINRTDLTGDWFDSLDRCFGWSNRQEQQALG